MVIVVFLVLGGSWFKKFKFVFLVYVFGWMWLCGVRWWCVVDRGFVLSDYVDWDGLNFVIKVIGVECVFVIYGYMEVFSKWL